MGCGLTFTELQTGKKKLLFFACIVGSDAMSQVVKDIFSNRAKEYRNNRDCVATGFLGDTLRLLQRYVLHSYFSLWINENLFPSYA